VVITQDMYDVCKQSNRNIRIKINILDSNYQILDEISGNVITGNVSIDANSDIRRTCSLSLSVTDDKFTIVSGGEIWFNRYVQIFVGIDKINTDEIVWINIGIYLIDAPAWLYDSQSKTLSFNGLDLMSKMTGLRNGNLEGIPTSIPSGTNIREAMISTITQLGGFSKYAIQDNTRSLPYEIKIDVGGTVYDILSKLRDVYPMWQIYFDVDGVFHFEEIPIGLNDPVLFDDDLLSPNVLTENVNVNFEDVKNVCEVFGKSINPTYFAQATLINGNTIHVDYPGVTSYDENSIYGFISPSGVESLFDINFQINNLDVKALEPFDNPFDPIRFYALQSNVYYVAKYMVYAGKGGELNSIGFLGNQTPHYIAEDINPNSPFYINGDIGRVRKVFSGGEYENIYTVGQVRERADWELYQHTNLNNSITLSCIPIYFLDVNILGKYTTKFDNTLSEYIIKSISIDLSEIGTQTINMIKYYPYYE